MRVILAIALLGLLASHGDCFGLLSTNPIAMINAGKMMTRFIMSNMARKRTGTNDGVCVRIVGRAAEDFFVGASRALSMLKLIEETKARNKDPSISSSAVPLGHFCGLVNVQQLREVTNRLVARLRCLGSQAQDEAGRLFRSLVYTVDHVCQQGGKPAQQFMDDIEKCRRLDANHEETLGEIKSFNRARRSLTASARLSTAAVQKRTTETAAFPVPQPTSATGTQSLLITLAATTTTTTTTATTTVAPGYASLQACFDDVNELLPKDVKLLPQEELSDFLVTLPRMIPRLLEANGLTQFCPALLKGADCAHYSVSQCPANTQHRLARFFQTVLRGILCDGIPPDDQLASYIIYSQVKQFYFNL